MQRLHKLERGKSNAVVTGRNRTSALLAGFLGLSSTALFTFFHGEGAKPRLEPQLNALNYWGSPADAWAVLPKFHLEAGGRPTS